jgi:hypothetical protein
MVQTCLRCVGEGTGFSASLDLLFFGDIESNHEETMIDTPVVFVLEAHIIVDDTAIIIPTGFREKLYPPIRIEVAYQISPQILCSRSIKLRVQFFPDPDFPKCPADRLSEGNNGRLLQLLS